MLAEAHAMQPQPEPEPDAYFVLAVWCTAARAWHDLPARYGSAPDARDAARERGIYRVCYVCDGRRLDLDAFAFVGDD
jgi:hypothetical protein